MPMSASRTLQRTLLDHKDHGIKTTLVDDYMNNKFTELRFRLYDHGLPGSNRTTSGRGRPYDTLLLKCYKQGNYMLLHNVSWGAIRLLAGVFM